MFPMPDAPSDKTFFRGLDLPARNENTELSIAELRRCRKSDRLILIMHFPHYYEAAKKDLFLRTMVIYEAERYLQKPEQTENMTLLCERLRDEYRKYEESLATEEHVRKISALDGHELCIIASTNFFLRRIILHNSRLRMLLLGALEHEIEDTQDTPFFEYLIRCIQSNIWTN